MAGWHEGIHQHQRQAMLHESSLHFTKLSFFCYYRKVITMWAKWSHSMITITILLVMLVKTIFLISMFLHRFYASIAQIEWGGEEKRNKNISNLQRDEKKLCFFSHKHYLTSLSHDCIEVLIFFLFISSRNAFSSKLFL